jgi:tRNA pseudouridine13 synthase
MENINEGFNSLKESDVGITEYICNSTLGFNCVLKHRYSDFLVNEIDPQGNVVWTKSNDNSEKKDDCKTLPEVIGALDENEIEKILQENFQNLIKNEEMSKFKEFTCRYINK